MTISAAFFLLTLLAALLIYLYATPNYVEAPSEITPSARESINYYGFRGPMFLENFKVDDIKGCQIPTLTAEGSWRNEYHNAVYRLGGPDAFRQVTNNNLSAPNNLKAAQMKSVMGDYFDPADKISPWCYATSAKN
jgi:hypothetical protein